MSLKLTEGWQPCCPCRFPLGLLGVFKNALSTVCVEWEIPSCLPSGVGGQAWMGLAGEDNVLSTGAWNVPIPCLSSFLLPVRVAECTHPLCIPLPPSSLPFCLQKQMGGDSRIRLFAVTTGQGAAAVAKRVTHSLFPAPLGVVSHILEGKEQSGKP